MATSLVLPKLGLQDLCLNLEVGQFFAQSLGLDA
jgi:hypothetical protein